ncbi:Ger(x)C family spore germination protein [uncultured Brevibacillus sp.]|uniref:Ger(x)C family spore germination protein n=1 Tax=uncultured Brevibacillus sp. TaxID=169970 RepID=UPI0025920D4B|nr:Ger(x)C family spore germination protein [uncultured Brevibacillus sp.]
MRAYKLLQKLFIFIAMLPMLLTTGCWSSIELNNRSFARMLLVDKAESGVELTLAFPLPNRLIPGQSGTGGPQTGKPYTYITKTGQDIGEAYRSIQSDLSRSITFGQTSVVVIGHELAKEGITPVLEFIAREPRFHINADLFVTQGRVLDLTTVPIVFERFPADILIAYGREHVTVNTTTTDCLITTYHGGDMIMPLLKIETKHMPGEKPEAVQWLGTDGAAIFREGKLQRTLSTDEMRGALWIMGQLKDAEISVHSTTDGKSVNYMINKARTKITPSISGDKVSILIRTKAEASLISSDSNVNLQDPVQRKKLQRGIEILVEERMNKAIEKARKAGADVFSFGQYVDWHYPKEWNTLATRWRELYSRELKVITEADITIKRIGSVKEPTKIRKTSHPEGKK